MGYRSKVIIGVKNGQLSDIFDLVLAKHNFKVRDHFSDYLNIQTENDGMKFYEFKHTKWYETDEWCNDIMDFLVESDGTDRHDESDVFCIGLGEDGTLHSEVGYWENNVEQISEINLIF